MSRALVINVRLHDARYHGTADWPPAPARVFQALVAGAGLSGPLGKADSQALAWLELLEPPIVAAPVARVGQRVMLYMPNNDLDAVGGDVHRAAKIRTARKYFTPRLFDPSIPLMYVWPLDHDGRTSPHPQAICGLVDRLYQLGRGVDMAWAWGEVLDAAALEARLLSYTGNTYRPSLGGTGGTLACPLRGSLASLRERYRANGDRFSIVGTDKEARQVFSQAPRPSFRLMAYESPSSRRVYEIREPSSDAPFAPGRLAHVSRLVEGMRDRAADRLRRVLPKREADIARVLVGRKPDGTNDGPVAARVRIVPLPSIGHPNADRAIRRVLVEVPPGCPLRADDVNWAFSGLELVDTDTGEVTVLTPAGDEAFSRHYGVGARPSHVWRSVTPVALPESAGRRRIEPTRRLDETKNGSERAAEHARAAATVAQALRHAGVRSPAHVIRVQREPFGANVERVEGFAQGTRFAKERLWHVELTFATPLSGPLVIGDGRFLGLGVMAPLTKVQGLHAFVVEHGLVGTPDPTEVTRALRRAAMARVQDALGPRASLSAFFSGHEPDGAPARTEHPHLTFVFDPLSRRLLVIAPHVIERRAPRREETDSLELLDAALTDFRDLRAGVSGRLSLRASVIDVDVDLLFAASRTWDSVTPYQVTRHLKRVGADEALAADLRAECGRRGLPDPRVTPRRSYGTPGGLTGMARLEFEVAVAGPLVLGRSRHLGGGLFVGVSEAGT